MAQWVKYVHSPFVWHWCKNCSKYPSAKEGALLIMDSRPPHSLDHSFCNECRGLELDGKCGVS